MIERQRRLRRPSMHRIRAIEGGRCELANHGRSKATDEFRAFLDRQGIPFDAFRVQRQPSSIARNCGEAPFFAAASIERAALREYDGSPATR